MNGYVRNSCLSNPAQLVFRNRAKNSAAPSVGIYVKHKNRQIAAALLQLFNIQDIILLHMKQTSKMHFRLVCR